VRIEPTTAITRVRCEYNNNRRGQTPTTRPTRSRRINLRASTPQETLIRAGAKVRGVNLTDFILESACTRAEQIIADQSTFTLTPQQWKAFADALDRPPVLHPKPRLKRLLSEPSIAESR
jgi:uncharacterized protein (DUF1778 family)